MHIVLFFVLFITKFRALLCAILAHCNPVCLQTHSHTRLYNRTSLISSLYQGCGCVLRRVFFSGACLFHVILNVLLNVSSILSKFCSVHLSNNNNDLFKVQYPNEFSGLCTSGAHTCMFDSILVFVRIEPFLIL